MTPFEIILSIFMIIVLIILVKNSKKKDQFPIGYVPPVPAQEPSTTATPATPPVSEEPKPESWMPPDAAEKRAKRPIGAYCVKTFLSAWSKFKFWIQHWDAFWTFPAFMTLYYFVGLALVYIFGWATSMYRPEFIQPLFLAGGAVTFAVNVSQFILWLTFRTVKRYIWGKHRPEEQAIINYSKDDFKNLKGWQKILISIGLFLFFVTAVLVVFLKMV